MPPEPTSNEASRNRRLVSQLLVAALFAVAYSEPVGPVTEAFDTSGVNLQNVAWMAIYMATVLRFFIGNILHLEKRDLIASEGIFKWFFDLGFIVLQCVVLIFAGAVTTIDSSSAAEVTFTDYLAILYALDVIWLLSMQALDRLGRRWPRSRLFGPMVRRDDMAPLQWAEVNIVLALMIGAMGLIGGHPDAIPDWKLWVLLAINAYAFGKDVVVIAYGIREPEAGGTSPLALPIKRPRSWSSRIASWVRRIRSDHDAQSGMDLATKSARESLSEGGIPIGAALLDEGGQVIGVGHNRRLQSDNPILHAEMDCLATASRRHDYAGTTLYSTLMPCYMCAGAVIQFGIPRVVVGESENFQGARDLLLEHGVEVVDLNDPVCKEMLKQFIQQNPESWHEDIGN